MEDEVKPGTYYLDFAFIGQFQTNYTGIYRAQYYAQETNQARTLVVTNCKSIHAREIYPCFDEPEMKAKYRLRIVRPAENSWVVTSGVVEKEEFGPEKNEVTVFFKQTKPMPTFLTGFVIADLKESAFVNVGNRAAPTAIKIFSRSDNDSKSSFAKGIAEAVAKYFIDYFEIPVPFDKLDLVALPNFPTPISEHFGYVIFNESLLLFDEEQCSVEDMKKSAVAIAGAFCQQWFGCLVTMKNWEDYWVTEGFCCFMQYKVLEEGVKSCATWNLADQVMCDIIQPVMYRDAFIESHPLHGGKGNPQQKSVGFDELSRYKGMALFRMLEGFIGKENFRNGVHNFLNEHMLSCATAGELWEYLNNEISDPDVSLKDVMGPWTRQSGFPVIYVIKRANTWVLSQSKFIANRDAADNMTYSPHNYKWDVPIFYVTSNDMKPILVWFKKSEECLKVTMMDRTVSYVKFNHRQTGYYRVNYEGCLWRQFGQLLQQDPSKFDILDRVNLLDDVFHLAEAGETDYPLAFELLKYLVKENDYLPWATVSVNIKMLLRRLSHTPCYGLLMKFIRSMVGRLYGSVEGQYSWNSSPNDCLLTRLLRVIILDLASMSKMNGCLTDLGVKFREWIRTGDLPVHKDLIRLMFCYGMREVGTLEDWDIVWKRYQKETDIHMKDCLLDCLANVRENWLLITLLENTQNEIRECDYISFMKYVSESPYSSEMQWRFVRNGWEYLAQRFSSRAQELHKLVLEMCAKFNTKTELEEVEEFFRKHPEVSNEEDQKLLKCCISRNINFCARYRDIISSWITENLAQSA
ncbi:UNVERIFIED_CONTAM: hypothetical protein PYX00_002840 [Menopon gallinae]